MTGDDTDKAAANRRKTEHSARMVLAKHPCVVAGSAPPARQVDEAALAVSGEADAIRILRGLR